MAITNSESYNTYTIKIDGPLERVPAKIIGNIRNIERGNESLRVLAKTVIKSEQAVQDKRK